MRAPHVSEDLQEAGCGCRGRGGRRQSEVRGLGVSSEALGGGGLALFRVRQQSLRFLS